MSIVVWKDRLQRGLRAMHAFDQTPDKPRAFGFKVNWFAVKASDPASVLDALGFSEPTPANWSSGLAIMYGGDSWVFASPPFNGWVLVASHSLPYPTNETHHDIGKRFDELFSRLMKRFDDVQFFGSHRVVGFVTWARALNGKPIRVFSYADEIMANVGEQTAEEAKLGFANLGGLSPSDALDEMFRIAEEQSNEQEALVATGLSQREARARVLQKGRDAIPNETDVVDLAAFWSIDPSRLEDQDYPPGSGLAARLPKDFSQ